MKKRLKKGLGSLFLMISLISSSIQSIYAAPEDIIDTNKKGSITIYKYDITAAQEDGLNLSTDTFLQNGQEDVNAKELLSKYVIPGVEFSYLKVGDFFTNIENGKVQVLYTLPEELEKALNLNNSRNNHRYTSDEINKGLSDVLVSNTEGKNILETYIQKSNGQQMNLTDKNGMTTQKDLDLGLYLIVETKVPSNVDTSVNPFFVTLPMTDQIGNAWFYDVEVYPKNQTSVADLDKLVKESGDENADYLDTTSVSQGDTVDYIFVSHLPKITSYATYLTKYQFTDTVDYGLNYGKDVKIQFYNNEQDAKKNHIEKAVKTWTNNEAMFKTTYKQIDDKKKQMVVDITSEGLQEINTSHSEQWMVVSYTCKVNSDASTILGDTGNKNTVNLKWKRTSDVSEDSIEDFAKVYSYGLNIKKKFSDIDGKATDVKFILKNEKDGYWVKAKKEKSGVYYVTDEKREKSEKEATIFSPSEDGTLVIHGLEADIYTLTETATSKGYSLLKDPMIIRINGTIELNSNGASATVDEKETNMSEYMDQRGTSNHAFVDLQILNTKTFTLPQTGGIGTLLFTLAGCSAALAGVLILTKKPHKDHI